jgi:hypothetical protein
MTTRRTLSYAPTQHVSIEMDCVDPTRYYADYFAQHKCGKQANAAVTRAAGSSGSPKERQDHPVDEPWNLEVKS